MKTFQVIGIWIAGAVAGIFIELIVVAFAESIGVGATVAASYECGIKKFDLVCQTNAQNIIINGKKLNVCEK